MEAKKDTSVFYAYNLLVKRISKKRAMSSVSRIRGSMINPVDRFL